jgi:hypothetical protein
VCEFYENAKFDYIYRGDIFEDVPFISLDGEPVVIQNDDPNRRGRDFLHTWETKNFREGKEYYALTVVSFGPGVVLSRTCETAKVGGKRKVFPASLVAPIRALVK